MPLVDQRHTVRFPLPDLIVRDVSHTIKAPVYLDGALVAPSSGTVSVYNAENTAVVNAQPATITASIAEYTIGSGDLTSETLGEKWRVEWSLTLSGGEILTPRNSAALVRNGLWPVISDVDITRRLASLNTTAANGITAAADYQDEMDHAWTKIQRRLIRRGNRPNLIMEPSALADCHEALTLAYIFEGRLASRLQPAYREDAEGYFAEYEKCWNELTFEYDLDDDGEAEEGRRSAQPSVWLNGRGEGSRWRVY